MIPDDFRWEAAMGKDHLKFPPSIGTFRFASIAVSRKYITPEQVQNAIAEQEEDYITGRPQRFLGEILLENYLITEEQMESILEEMGVGDE
jgi:hypothetical protein